MGFYDKYKKVKTRNIKDRETHKEVVISSIMEQLEVNNGSILKENKPKTKGGGYVRSWFQRDQVTPVIKGLKFYDNEDEGSLTVGDVDRLEFLRDMKKGVEDGDLDEDIESFGKRRDERDKKVVEGMKKT